MIRYGLFFTGLIFLSFACQTNDAVDKQKDGDIPVVNPDSIAAIPGTEPLPADTTAVNNTLENFPKYWVEIKKRGNELVYTDYCNMEHPYLEITKQDGSWQIYTMYGQDGELWEILGMDLNEEVVNEQIIRSGRFLVKKITYPDDEVYSAGYFWNVTTGRCTFGDFFDPSRSFADNAMKDSFVFEKEPCDH